MEDGISEKGTNIIYMISGNVYWDIPGWASFSPVKYSYSAERR
jgi:hypothetical protein